MAPLRGILLLAGLLLAAAPPPGPALAAADPAAEALVARARERSRALARRGSWTHEEVAALAALQLGDPARFDADEEFRRRMLALLPRELDPRAPAGLRGALLTELNQVRGFDFAAAEEVGRAWGAIPRRSAERRVPF